MKDGKIPNPMTIHPIAGYDKKLEYFNANYIRQLSTEELYKWTLPFITGTGDALLEINPENPQPKPNVGPEFSGVALGWNYRFCII